MVVVHEPPDRSSHDQVSRERLTRRTRICPTKTLAWHGSRLLVTIQLEEYSIAAPTSSSIETTLCLGRVGSNARCCELATGHVDSVRWAVSLTRRLDEARCCGRYGAGTLSPLRPRLGRIDWSLEWVRNNERELIERFCRQDPQQELDAIVHRYVATTDGTIEPDCRNEGPSYGRKSK